MALREANKEDYGPDLPRSARPAMAVSDLANTGKSLDIHLRYETTFSRAFDRAQKTLDKMQKIRLQSTATEELRNEPAAEPEASTPTNEYCETALSPQTPRPVELTNEPNPKLMWNE